MDDHRFDRLARLAATASRRQLFKALLGAAGGGLLGLGGVRRAAARPCFAGAQDCPGCCAGQFCEPGDTGVRCGKGGYPCVSCTEGQVCQGGACMEQGEAEACGPANCRTGCCKVIRIGPFGSPVVKPCRSGNAHDACGTGGEECVECEEDESCRLGQCGPCDGETCPNGCCLKGSGCIVDRWPYCGTGGRACATCQPGERCEGGTCTSCRNGCTGCCTREGVCVLPGTSREACGSGGVPCQSCGYRQLCINGICQACGADNCPLGCCEYDPVQGAPACQPGRSDFQCGTGGAECKRCNNGNRCANGVCVCDSLTCPEEGWCCRDYGVDVQCQPADEPACGTRGEPCKPCVAEDEECTEDGRCVPYCGFLNCPDGCCTSDRRCISSPPKEWCGAPGGGDCVPCTQGQICVDGVCRCTADSCIGCCFGDNCRDGDSPYACGRLGEVCTYCPPGEVCPAGRCVPCSQTCPDGCCESRICRPGTTDGLCGAGGAPCAGCSVPEERCVDHTCRRACYVFACPAGCCDADQLCQPGTADAACGPDGAQCTVCADGTRCDPATRTCVAGTEGGDGAADACTADTCPGGCCAGETCVSQPTDAQCGTSGGDCADCTAIGARCQGGACVCDAEKLHGAQCCEGATCKAGTSEESCGKDGGECTTCDKKKGEVCRNGECLREVGMDLPAIPTVPKGYAVASAGGAPPALLPGVAAAFNITPPPFPDPRALYVLSAVKEGTGGPTRTLKTLVVGGVPQGAGDALRLTYPDATPVDVDSGTVDYYEQPREDAARLGFLAVGDIVVVFSFEDHTGTRPGGSTLRKEVIEAIVNSTNPPGLFPRLPVMDPNASFAGGYPKLNGELRLEVGLTEEQQKRRRERDRDVVSCAQRREEFPDPAITAGGAIRGFPGAQGAASPGSVTAWIRQYASEEEATADFAKVPGWIAQDSAEGNVRDLVQVDEPGRYRIVRRFPLPLAQLAVVEWRLRGAELYGARAMSRPFVGGGEVPAAYNQALHETLDAYLAVFDCDAPCEEERTRLDDAIRRLFVP